MLRELVPHDMLREFHPEDWKRVSLKCKNNYSIRPGNADRETTDTHTNKQRNGKTITQTDRGKQNI